MTRSDRIIIEADLHCHSLACTHAYSTVDENAAAAQRAGLKIYALTDHGPAMPDAPHVWHFHNLGVLPQVISDVIVLRGVEADIMNIGGELDMNGIDLKFIQWVVASCHRPCIRLDNTDEYTDAYINAVKNQPLIDVIGHPTATGADYDRLAKFCREYEVFPELNESSVEFGRSGVPECVKLLDACKKYETPIVVDTDCHYSARIGRTPLAEKILEENDFPISLVFNADAQRVLEHVEKKHGKLDIR